MQAGLDVDLARPRAETEHAQAALAAERPSSARVLDAFGRTLELPVGGTITPTRESIADRPGALLLRPRLLLSLRLLLRQRRPLATMC